MEKRVFKQNNKKICLALGFFDCMHLGHRAIADRTKTLARMLDAQPAIFTFAEDIGKSLEGKSRQIYTFGERKTLFDSCGIENIVAYPFDEKTRNTDKLDFLSGLTEKYEISAFSCGEDYTFGRGKEGDVEFLKSFCNEKNIVCEVVPLVEYKSEKISSTRIKEFLAAGNVAEANLLLSENYFIENAVVRGRGEGHRFGFPTANVFVPADKFLPKEGVYATVISIDGKTYRSVTNVGQKPTFNDFEPTVEVLIKDFDGNLYGRKVKLSFVKFLRDIKKFDSPEQLNDRIHKDLQWE